MIYTYDEAYKATLEYFDNDELATDVWLKKYALTDNNNQLLEKTPTDSHRRLATEFARIEKNKFKKPLTEQEIFDLFDHFRYLVPGGRILFGLGNPYQYCTLSNCYVIDLYDSYASILKTDSDLINISSRGGGVGLDISALRPAGVATQNAAKTSTGAVSFMPRFSNSIKEVCQCIDGNAYVITKRGHILLKDVVQNDQVWTRSQWVNVENILKNKKELYEVITKRGYKIRTSIDHIYRMADQSEKVLSDIKIGDQIEMICGVNTNTIESKLQKYEYPKLDYSNCSNRLNTNLKLPLVLNTDLSYLLGYAYGNGYVSYDKNNNPQCLSISVPNNRSQILEKIISLTKHLFDYDITPTPGDGECCVLHISSKYILYHLYHNNILKSSAYTQKLPSILYYAKPEIQLSFIAGYFDADGDVSKKCGYRISSINLPFLQDLQQILLTNGIPSKIHIEQRKNDKWHILYKLVITGCYSTNLIYQQLLPYSKKITKLDKTGDRLLSTIHPKKYNIKRSKYNYYNSSNKYVSISCIDKMKKSGEQLPNHTFVDTIVDIIKLDGEYDVYDLVLDTEHIFYCNGFAVHNSGRRGAGIMTISVHHPDIEKFIDIKNNDTSVTGANISVRLTDEFLEAVKNKSEYELRWPVDSQTPKVSKNISAAYIWHKICKNAHAKAEPGVLFWDNILRESLPDRYSGYETISTNPCLDPSVNILTPNGLKQLKDIHINDKIWSEIGWTCVINKISRGIKPVYKYTTTTGYIHCTDNHQLLENGIKKEAKNCTKIDYLSGVDSNKFDLDIQDIMDGLVIGDGSVCKTSNNLVFLYIGTKDGDYFTDAIKANIIKRRFGKKIAYEINTTIQASELPYTYNRKIPDRFKYGSPAKVLGFLRGLFSANGSFISSKQSHRISLKATSKQVIDDVQLMLSSVGIFSYYTTNKATKIHFNNGDYTVKQSYNLNIGKIKDIIKFYNTIGFIQKYKQEKVKTYINQNIQSRKYKIAYKINNTEYVGDKEVFDITVDNNTHTFWCNGFNIGNCSEIPLSKNDSCRLLSINLYNYVDNPFTSKASLNISKLRQHANLAMRIMDDLIDLELESIRRIIDKISSDPEPYNIKRNSIEMWEEVYRICQEGRRTGIGTTGLADCLAALNLCYDSTDALPVIDTIYKCIKYGCYEQSIELAKQIGIFKKWDWALEKNNPFLQRFTQDPDGQKILQDLEKYGRRNIAILTNAPVGTQSCLTQTSSGIEPVFQLSYKRRKKIVANDTNSRIDFIDKTGDQWQEFEVLHPKLKDFQTITGLSIENSPWYNHCANDINWQKRIELQATAQKHIDHSISSTINLPENTTVEEVQKIYEYAWEQKLKGITVYRQGSRDGVLLENSKKDAIINKRPKELVCQVYHAQSRGKPYFILVGVLDDKPYEIFAGHNNGILKNSVKNGKIIRQKKGFYKAIFEDESELAPITATATDIEETITRLVSTSLRANIDLNLVVTQLEKTGGENAEMHGFAKILARVLKKYIKEGTKIEGETCPECGKTLIRKEGCWGCECGYQKCS